MSRRRLDDYDPRSDPRADPDDPSYREPRNRSKNKDRRRWCRGKVGVEHRIVLVQFKKLPCRTRTTPQGGTEWWCFHRRKCEVCGKALGFIKPGQCPDRKVTP